MPGLGQIVLVNVVLVIAILVAYGVWSGRRAAVWVGAVVVMGGLTVLTVRASGVLIREQMWPAPVGWQALQTHPEVRRLVKDIQTISAHTVGDPTEQPVQVQVAPMTGLVDDSTVARPDPILGWYLRDMRRLRWVSGPELGGDGPQPLVVMLNDDASFDDEQATYVGSTYDVEVYWQPDLLVDPKTANDGESTSAQLWPTLRRAWRWWLYHKLPEQPPMRTVTLWAPVGTGPTQ